MQLGSAIAIRGAMRMGHGTHCGASCFDFLNLGSSLSVRARFGFAWLPSSQGLQSTIRPFQDTSSSEFLLSPNFDHLEISTHKTSAPTMWNESIDHGEGEIARASGLSCSRLLDPYLHQKRLRSLLVGTRTVRPDYAARPNWLISNIGPVG